MLCGVALAAGGYTIATAVYIFGLEEYHPIVRPAVLTGFLGYLFVVIGLLVDLGRPWKLPVPMVYSYGTASVMFEVGWCVALYLTVLALEFSPAVFEWLGLKQGAREWALQLTLALTILGLVLSTLHQSSLGALFLMMPHRVHPLWYSGFIPVFFFVSAIIAGLSMVIVESALSHRAFPSRVDPHSHAKLDTLTLGLARGRRDRAVRLLLPEAAGPGGRRALRPAGHAVRRTGSSFEMLGFILAPSLLFGLAVRRGNATARAVGGRLDGARASSSTG